MRFILIIISLGLGLFLEWSIGLRLSFWSLTPPLFAFFLILWLWRFPIFYGLILSAVSGFALESISSAPFGTYLFLFLALVFLVNFLRSIFSVTESFLVYAFGVGICVFLFMIFYSLTAEVLGALSGNSYTSGALFYQTALAAVFWSLVLAFVFGGAVWIIGLVRPELK